MNQKNLVVCTNKTACHITSIGVKPGITGVREVQSVAQVYRNMALSDVYFTFDTVLQKVAIVRKYRCSWCGRDTLRSDADCTTRNNLDTLNACPAA